MFNRKTKNQSPSARATRAQSNIFVRLIGCGLLIYILVQLVTSEDFSSGDLAKVAVAVVLGIAALVIIVLTIIELVRNIKAGAYTTNYYSSQEETVENRESDDTPKQD